MRSTLLIIALFDGIPCPVRRPHYISLVTTTGFVVSITSTATYPSKNNPQVNPVIEDGGRGSLDHRSDPVRGPVPRTSVADPRRRPPCWVHESADEHSVCNCACGCVHHPLLPTATRLPCARWYQGRLSGRGFLRTWQVSVLFCVLEALFLPVEVLQSMVTILASPVLCMCFKCSLVAT